MPFFTSARQPQAQPSFGVSTTKRVITMKLIVFIISIFASCSLLADEMYSVYLVRHAEKDLSNPDNRNPELLPCGSDRSERLADILANVDLKAIYSTDFARTRSTAKPTANAKKLPVQIYDPYKLDVFSEQLAAKKQDALVVGHSNTTNVLAGKLAGIELEELDEEEYDRLYQVVVANGSAKLQLLHQAFRCAR
jgi:broad specificity phosphatase PhoE